MEQENQQEMREYEIGAWVKNVEDMECVKSFAAEAGVQIVQEQAPKRIHMAYPIQKELSAFFAVLGVRATVGAMEALQHELRVQRPALRFVVVKGPMKQTTTRPFMPRRGAPTGARRREREHEVREERPSAHKPESVTNEELEKKLEEILQ
jgi:ribosomal protein S6